ncbi:MAG: YegS/Rv2252/BmrU family lipid kinase [Leptolyngbyaceae cyanobacterium]
MLVDESGSLRYLTIDTDSHRQLLLPIERWERVSDQNHMYVTSLNREEFKALAEYDDTHSTKGASVDQVDPQAADPPVESSVESDRLDVQLLEERLVTQTQRVKTGEVKISKHTVTESVEASVPVTKEKVIIEIESVYGGQTQVDVDDAQVAEDGTVRVGIYEEQAMVCRQVVPYQNVAIRKETVADTVVTQEQLRRETLDTQTDGSPVANSADEKMLSKKKAGTAPALNGAMFENIFLIFNPVSGRGDPERDLALIRREIGSKAQLSVLETTPEKSAVTLARLAKDKGADCIIASGGDGTVSAVAGALMGSDVALGIIPRGTANAIAAAFDISNDLTEACNTILTGVAQKIDVASCNQRPFILLAGIGLEADVISQANRQLKNKVGSAAYILSAFQQVQELTFFQVEMEMPDRVITVKASGITVANVAPATSVLAQGPADVLPRDGLLDVTIFAPEGTGGALTASYNLFQSALNDTPVQREDVGYFRCSGIKVSTEPAQKVVLDGEMIGTTPIEVKCIPKGLTLMVPRHNSVVADEKLEGLPDLTVRYK